MKKIIVLLLTVFPCLTWAQTTPHGKLVFVSEENKNSLKPGNRFFNILNQEVDITDVSPGVYICYPCLQLQQEIVSANFDSLQPTTYQESFMDRIVHTIFTSEVYAPWSVKHTTSRSQLVDPCAHTHQDAYSFIDQVSAEMLSHRGPSIADSILAFNARAKAMEDAGTFLYTVSEVPFTPISTLSYSAWVAQVVSGAHTRKDSLNKLCVWIGTNYPYSDYDGRVDSLDVDSVFTLVAGGYLYGQCGDYATFLAKVVRKSFPQWGTPMILQTQVDSAVTGGLQPSHVFMGILDSYGKIYIVGDPTVGSVVTDNHGNVVSFDKLKRWSHQTAHYNKLKVTPVQTSTEVGWAPCLIRMMLRDTIGMTFCYAPTGIDLCKGHWFTYGEKGSIGGNQNVPLWRLYNFPGNSILNLHSLSENVAILSHDPNLLLKVRNRYHFTDISEYQH